MGAMTENRTNDTARDSDAKGGEHERIAKVLARAGLCSRREAEDWIAAGRVAVDGKVLTTPAVTVGPESRIVVDGQPLPVKERTRLWLFHKPRGLVTTTSDPEGRPTVFSVLPDDMPRVITVGRLDINTEGLLLLTNDGGLARVLELPSTGWLRRYRVRAFGEIDQAALDELKQGVSIDGVDYGPIDAVIDRVQGSNIWLVVGLREGKNREVKRVLGSLGLTVNRLIRISFGPFQLADLEEGEIREIRGRVLRDQLGKRLVEESGADFEAPLIHHIHGAEEPDEGPKRRIKDFTPAGDGDERATRGRRDDKGAPRGRTPRTKMEFIGTGEKRREGGRGEREERGERAPRSEGFRGRPGGPKSGGFRDRPQGGEGGRYRSEGFRDGGERSAGFRGRSDGGEGREYRSEGFRGRPAGDKPRSEGFRGRPGEDRPKSGGFRDRPRGEDGPAREGRSRPPRDERGFGAKPDRFRDREGGGGEGRGHRSEGFRDGGNRSEGFRDGGNRSEGFRGRPDAAGGGRSAGYRDRPEGGGRSGGFRDRPEGASAPRSGGFRDRPEGGAAKPKSGPKARVEGFGPRGPRGMSAGGRKEARDTGPSGGERGRGGPKGGGAGKGGPKGGPRGGGKGGPKGGPRGGRS